MDGPLSPKPAEAKLLHDKHLECSAYSSARGQGVWRCPWDVRQRIGYKKHKSNIEAWEFLSAIIYHRGRMFN